MKTSYWIGIGLVDQFLHFFYFIHPNHSLIVWVWVERQCAGTQLDSVHHVHSKWLKILWPWDVIWWRSYWVGSNFSDKVILVTILWTSCQNCPRYGHLRHTCNIDPTSDPQYQQRVEAVLYMRLRVKDVLYHLECTLKLFSCVDMLCEPKWDLPIA